MQGAIARVCVVLAAALLNHPRLFPQENATHPDQDQELMARMREREERLQMEQAKLEDELSRQNSEQEETAPDEAYGRYLWSAVSFVIFFTIEMCRLDLADAEARPVEDEDVLSESGWVTPGTMALDKDVLRNFCDKFACATSHEVWRVREFVGGFADDLLESLRSVCDRDTDVEVGDFVGIGSTFESSKVFRPLICDLLVPFSPPEQYCFQFHLWCGASSDTPPTMQGCGRMTVTRSGENGERCLCGSANLADDVLCLLHGSSDTLKADRAVETLLCSKNTHSLAKDRVMKWFQISLTRAWARISHKYDFEVTFRNLDTAGALKIRLRSGKVVLLNVIPAVQLEDTKAYLVPHFPSDCESSPDPYWPLSFAVYERSLLKHFAKRLPQNSCHLHCFQIITFLHRKQRGLTGESGLTSYHLKTVLLHLLLSKRPSAWGVSSTEDRLRDALGFLQRSLQEKRLDHVVVGNRKIPEDIDVPEVFRKAEPINLFRPLVLRKELYAATVGHFREMLRNAPALMQEYTSRFSNEGSRRSREENVSG
ncbi:inositol 1,4,5-trisphosphate receptor-interacting protein [Brachionichthys hirsutus]|uniref:inositol 1,4,5-trisphosphate receptor-interacting protein n=1 Tax=Brachionichthys hirsutus TaxID=412623 RepID=UPI0036043AC5